MEIEFWVILRIRHSRSVNIFLKWSDFELVTEQVVSNLFCHHQDHFQKYDYVSGFLFALCNYTYTLQFMQVQNC